MGIFGLLFWLAVLWFAFRMFRTWSCGRGGYWDDRRLERGNATEEQQPYIESLEARVAELEERLDFTERLVARRQESGASLDSRG